MSKDKKLIPQLRFPEFLNDEEWAEKLIGDITISESSSMALNKLELKPKGYPVYGADSIVGYIDNFQQQEKYISIVKDGSGVGRLNLCQSHSSILGTLACLKSKNQKLYYLDWIYYLLNTVDFSVYVKGAGIPHIYYSDFKFEKIATPKPQEQQKIASCLSSLDELIATHNDKLQALKDHKKGLMQNLFPHPSTSSGCSTVAELVEAKVPNYRFPEFEGDGEWYERNLGKIGEFVGGGTPSTSKPEYWDGGIQWYTPTEVKNGTLKPSIRTITEEGLKNSSAKLLPQGTILITTRATIGDAAITSYECTTNQGFQSLIVKKSEVNLFWYYWILQHKIELVRRSSGSTFKEIGKNEIKVIPTLSPKKEEQQKIAFCLSTLDELITAQSEKIEQLQQHKKGLMQGLFPKIMHV